MKIRRIDIEAFGCLSDFSAEVAPGLHVFYGPNEAGKSTLQQAMLALLYGFYAGDRARLVESALRQRYTPWSDIRYSAKLEYMLQDGRQFRVDRNFSTPDVATTLWDIVVGRDVTGEFGLGRHGNVPFMAKQLGMPKGVFEACAFVSQGELFDIAGQSGVSPQEIGDTIVSLADTGRRDVSAQSAIDRLEKVVKEQVGGPTARTTALPVARNKLREAEGELAVIEQARSDVAREAADLDRAIRDSRELREEITRTRYLVAVVEAVELRKRLGGLSELDERETKLRSQLGAAQPSATFPAEERDRVLRVHSQIGELQKRVAGRSDEIGSQRARILEITRQKDELAGRRTQLWQFEGYPVDRRAEIDQTVRAWQKAETRHDQAQERLTASAGAAELVSEYESLEPKVGALTPDDRQRLMARLQAPNDPAAGRGLIRALAGALLWLILALPRLFALFLSRVRKNRAAVALEAPVPADSRDPLDLLHKHTRFLELAPLVRRYRDDAAAVQGGAQALEAAADAVRAALSGIVDDMNHPDAAYAAFCEGCARAGELTSIDVQLSGIERERRAVTNAIGAYEGDCDRAESLEAQLRRELEAAVSARGTLEALVAAFEAGCEGRRAYEEAKRGLGEADKERAAYLMGKSRAELEQMLRKRERDTEALLEGEPGLRGVQTNEGWQSLRETLKRQEAGAQALEVRIAELKTAIDAALKGLRPRAEVEEEIERCCREVESLERFGKALNVAKDVIDRAMTEAHREFAPRVGRLLSEGLERVTDGRYVRAFLDPATFRVTTEVPETRSIQDVESLSRGTRAAAYLLLRVGLAQHMSSMSEPVPLVLDDPLVDLDDVRAGAFLELMLRLAQDVQILLFTKDPATREWFEVNCAEREECRLTVMTAGRRAASSVQPVAAR